MTDKRLNVSASFNTDFLGTLEYHLSTAFKNADDPELRRFWCDGIYEPMIHEQFTDANITSINQVITSAWIGIKATDKYQMTIRLGACARKRALKGLDLNCCLPDANSFNWIEIDVESNTVKINLK